MHWALYIVVHCYLNILWTAIHGFSLTVIYIYVLLCGKQETVCCWSHWSYLPGWNWTCNLFSHICVNRIHWSQDPLIPGSLMQQCHSSWWSGPVWLFLLYRSDSGCVSRPSSGTNQSRPSQVKRPRWPAPSEYPCLPVAGLQDLATSPMAWIEPGFLAHGAAMPPLSY